ncbi:hypothetical protein KSS87_009457 [Heliosperma pusillum]|nr:hypothetical protein KSS87_009457 [Heliosperma pusillum]
MAAIAGVYRRTLPSPPAIEFASPQGKQLFVEALTKGNMDGFFKLISYYQTQSEPAYCGLATLAVVLNALSIDPGRKWKGPWRWFDDTMLDCCEPLEKVKISGISFGKVACLAHCNGAKVDTFRTNECTEATFREYVSSCTRSEDYHMIVSYHRGYLKQTGSGHFSPVGGYHAEKDMVLILDVARFKYPPHWVPLTLLWDAMNTVDEDTGLHRGFMLISRLERAPSILYTVSCRQVDCETATKYLTEMIPHLLSSEDIESVDDIISVIFTSAPKNLKNLINWVAEVRKLEDKSKCLSEEENRRLVIKEEILKQVQETELYKHVIRWLLSESPCMCDASFSSHSSFREIASEVCHQGAQLLCGNVDYATCSKSSQLKSAKTDNLQFISIASGSIIMKDPERGVEMLVPCCQRKSGSLSEDGSNASNGNPSVDDVLTVLILALPPSTWSYLKHLKLREDFYGIVSTDNLPDLLRQEFLTVVQYVRLAAGIASTTPATFLNRRSPPLKLLQHSLSEIIWNSFD